MFVFTPERSSAHDLQATDNDERVGIREQIPMIRSQSHAAMHRFRPENGQMVKAR
jgi:hypothetical protein